MILDILLGGWLIMAGLLGFRDGIVRKLVSGVMTIAGLVLGSVFMGDAAKLLVEKAAIDPADGPLYGYLIVFFGILIVQSLVYKFASGSYKIGGIADRMGGAALGVAQGVLFLSAFLYIIAMTGWPSKSLKRDSRIYRSVVNVAPQILDAVMTTAPESLEQIKEIARPESAERAAGQNTPARPQALRQAAQQKAQRANALLDSARTSVRR